MNDDELIEGIKNQNIKSLYNFIDKYGKIIYAVLNKTLDKNHEKQLIDECFDDILMIIWYHIGSYDASRGNFISWLISITKYKAIDYKRKDNKLYNLCDIDQLNIEDSTQVDEELLKIEQKKELETCMNKLNKDDKEILTQRYLNEENIDSISAIVKTSKVNVYNRLSRCRKKLKKLLEGNLYE